MKLSELNINGTPKEITPTPKTEKPKVDRRIAQVITDFRIMGRESDPFSFVVCKDGSQWALMMNKERDSAKWNRIENIPED